MNTCIICDKSLTGEKVVLIFRLINMAFCEACMMGERATKILAGLVERRRVELW